MRKMTDMDSIVNLSTLPNVLLEAMVATEIEEGPKPLYEGAQTGWPLMDCLEIMDDVINFRSKYSFDDVEAMGSVSIKSGCKLITINSNGDIGAEW